MTVLISRCCPPVLTVNNSISFIYVTGQSQYIVLYSGHSKPSLRFLSLQHKQFQPLPFIFLKVFVKANQKVLAISPSAKSSFVVVIVLYVLLKISFLIIHLRDSFNAELWFTVIVSHCHCSLLLCDDKLA